MSDLFIGALGGFEVVAVWRNDGTADLDMHHRCGWWATSHEGDSSASAAGSLLDLVNEARAHLADCPEAAGSVVPPV